MNTPQLGWIGLGNMGKPIVKNLLGAGYAVSVYNRTKSKEQPLIAVGATAAATPQQLLQKSDIVFTMVSNDEAVQQVYTGTDGLLSQPQRDKLIIDMSTVAPTTSRYIAALCKGNGIDFLDAPVSGSVKPAEEGTLIILVGGAEAPYQKAKPVLEVIGKLSIHLGENGAGSTAKLAINYLLGLNLQGLAEAVLFARQNGIATNDMLTIINEGACGNGITRGKTPAILANEFPAAFALKHLVKDLRLAKEAGLGMPLFAPLFQSYQQAMQSGLGEKDVMAIMQYLEETE